MSEDRQRGPLEPAVARHEIGRRVEFANVIGVMLGHGPVAFFRAIARIGNEGDPLGLDVTFGQGPREFIVAAGQCQFQVSHVVPCHPRTPN